VLRRLGAYAARHRGLVAASVAVMVVVGLLDLLVPHLVGRAIDGPIRVGSAEGLVRHGLLLLAAIALGSLARSAQQYLTVLTGQRIGMSLRRDVFSHLQRMGLAYYDRHPVGVLVTRVTSDVEAVEEFFQSGVAGFFYDLLKLILILAFLAFLDGLLALTVLAVVPPLLLVTAVFTRRSRRDFARVRAEVAAANGYAQEAIGGIRVTRLFDRADRATTGFREHVDRLYDAHCATIFNFAFFFPAVDLLQAIAVGAVVLVGADRIVDGSLTYGVLAQFVLLAILFFDPLRDLSQNFNTLLQAIVSSERVFRVMDTPEQVPPPEHPVPAAGIAGRVTFEDVRFEYVPKEPVLRGVSFEVPAGSTLALVGPTGAGKSSVIHLVSRFYDVTGGRVLVDGVDVRDYDPRALRSRIAVVLQDVFLFSGSVLENVRLWNPAISREKVEAAIRAVHADRLVARLPRGLDEDMRERGGNLSLGERQLIAFARALVHDPAILVLDEATSSIDTETEVAIQDAIRTLRAGRTTIVIAHRLSTVKDADQILVVKQGEVRERGTHAELLAMGGLYRRLYELQVREAGGGAPGGEPAPPRRDA
jgi:ATP-binding cassette subfamily B protein